jgi:dienelactone hydrolase
VFGWQRFVRERERTLAAASAPERFAGPAAVGLQFIAGSDPWDPLDPPACADEIPQLLARVHVALQHADTFFAPREAVAFRRQGPMLSFDSPSALPGPNGVARALLHESSRHERAVLLLPYWNAPRAAVRPFGALLARCGVTCLQLSLPYHDERMSAGAGFARELACENLGLTIASNRQAVLDARACLSFLEQEGYRRIGILGVSIGASIASIVAAIDKRVRAAAFVLMADDFAEATWTGTATRHVRLALEHSFAREDVRAAWSIISPASFAARLSERLDRLLIVSGDLDTVFVPELTQAYVDRLRGVGLAPTWIRYACGHYTLAMPPYAARAFLRVLAHFRACL